MSSSDAFAEKLAPARPLLEVQRGLLHEVDALWRPLMKLLVTAQNVYWPRVHGWIVLAHATAESPAGNTTEAAEVLLNRVGASEDELRQAYHFLVERGLRREPRDEMVMLRRAM